MRILISGLPLFARRLANDLKQAEPGSDFTAYDTYYSKTDQLRFMAALPFADAVISMNGVTDSSGSLDAVLLFKKKLIMQWQGTDVMLAVSRFKDGNIDLKYCNYATHWVDAPWLYEEVKSIGLEPETVHFKYATADSPIKNYSSISVISYVPQSRQGFYGINRILNLAKNNPDVQFNLYGCTSAEVDLPSNVNLHGWVSEDVFKTAMKNSAIFLRLTEHDGFSVSVIEAMSVGCEVIVTMPFDHAFVARSGEETLNAFTRAKEKIIGRGLTPNQEVIAYVQNNFKKQEVIANYLKKLHQFIGK